MQESKLVGTLTGEGYRPLRKALTGLVLGWLPSYQERRSQQTADSQYQQLRRLYKRPKYRWSRGQTGLRR